ncbi:hypothetical protein LSH36_286g01039 [Paralvinella palmiformis]|uniref:Uncharacterized protein n=1 Tax=Paralvinella palmiformis TaxID=53620 RepID=A0AAD9JIG5_9ANNE|nr:hypothetical protein LSH36_286g01039 [Paralvinella palmiformis]
MADNSSCLKEKETPEYEPVNVAVKMDIERCGIVKSKLDVERRNMSEATQARQAENVYNDTNAGETKETKKLSKAEKDGSHDDQKMEGKQLQICMKINIPLNVCNSQYFSDNRGQTICLRCNDIENIDNNNLDGYRNQREKITEVSPDSKINGRNDESENDIDDGSEIKDKTKKDDKVEKDLQTGQSGSVDIENEMKIEINMPSKTEEIHDDCQPISEVGNEKICITSKNSDVDPENIDSHGDENKKPGKENNLHGKCISENNNDSLKPPSPEHEAENGQGSKDLITKEKSKPCQKPFTGGLQNEVAKRTSGSSHQNENIPKTVSGDVCEGRVEESDKGTNLPQGDCVSSDQDGSYHKRVTSHGNKSGVHSKQTEPINGENSVTEDNGERNIASENSLSVKDDELECTTKQNSVPIKDIPKGPNDNTLFEDEGQTNNVSRTNSKSNGKDNEHDKFKKLELRAVGNKHDTHGTPADSCEWRQEGSSTPLTAANGDNIQTEDENSFSDEGVTVNKNQDDDSSQIYGGNGKEDKTIGQRKKDGEVSDDESGKSELPNTKCDSEQPIYSEIRSSPQSVTVVGNENNATRSEVLLPTSGEKSIDRVKHNIGTERFINVAKDNRVSEQKSEMKIEINMPSKTEEIHEDCQPISEVGNEKICITSKNSDVDPENIDSHGDENKKPGKEDNLHGKCISENNNDSLKPPSPEHEAENGQGSKDLITKEKSKPCQKPFTGGLQNEVAKRTSGSSHQNENIPKTVSGDVCEGRVEESDKGTNLPQGDCVSSDQDGSYHKRVTSHGNKSGVHSKQTEPINGENSVTEDNGERNIASENSLSVKDDELECTTKQNSVPIKDIPKGPNDNTLFEDEGQTNNVRRTNSKSNGKDNEHDKFKKLELRAVGNKHDTHGTPADSCEWRQEGSSTPLTAASGDNIQTEDENSFSDEGVTVNKNQDDDSSQIYGGNGKEDKTIGQRKKDGEVSDDESGKSELPNTKCDSEQPIYSEIRSSPQSVTVVGNENNATRSEVLLPTSGEKSIDRVKHNIGTERFINVAKDNRVSEQKSEMKIEINMPSKTEEIHEDCQPISEVGNEKICITSKNSDVDPENIDSHGDENKKPGKEDNLHGKCISENNNDSLKPPSPEHEAENGQGSKDLITKEKSKPCQKPFTGGLQNEVAKRTSGSSHQNENIPKTVSGDVCEGRVEESDKGTNLPQGDCVSSDQDGSYHKRVTSHGNKSGVHSKQTEPINGENSVTEDNGERNIASENSLSVKDDELECTTKQNSVPIKDIPKGPNDNTLFEDEGQTNNVSRTNSKSNGKDNEHDKFKKLELRAVGNKHDTHGTPADSCEWRQEGSSTPLTAASGDNIQTEDENSFSDEGVTVNKNQDDDSSQIYGGNGKEDKTIGQRKKDGEVSDDESGKSELPNTKCDSEQPIYSEIRSSPQSVTVVGNENNATRSEVLLPTSGEKSIDRVKHNIGTERFINVAKDNRVSEQKNEMQVGIKISLSNRITVESIEFEQSEKTPEQSETEASPIHVLQENSLTFCSHGLDENNPAEASIAAEPSRRQNGGLFSAELNGDGELVAIKVYITKESTQIARRDVQTQTENYENREKDCFKAISNMRHEQRTDGGDERTVPDTGRSDENKADKKPVPPFSPVTLPANVRPISFPLDPGEGGSVQKQRTENDPEKLPKGIMSSDGRNGSSRSKVKNSRASKKKSDKNRKLSQNAATRRRTWEEWELSMPECT